MEMNEKIAQSIRNEDSESKDKKEEKCKFIARAKRPSGKGPWYSGGKLGGIEDGDDLTGHSFCALEDEGGNRSWYGFYPKGAIIGWDSVPEEDRISGALDFFKYVAGILYHGDEDHEYDDEKVYTIEGSQYDKAKNFASKWASDKTKYCLALNNCTTFVVKDGKAGDVSVPGGGWAFANPNSFGKNLAKSK